MRLVDQIDEINIARGTAPVDVYSLAKRLGIVVREAFLDAEISGMIEVDDKTTTITLNAIHAPTRKRFTLAHEIGHYILHRDMIGDGLDDDCAYRSADVGKYHNTAIGPKQETQANKFAASLLMPKELVISHHSEIETGHNNKAATLADLFEVSEATMRIRLNTLNLQE